MAEHRFFQTFLTVGASMMLVGGSLVLLTSTSPFTAPPTEIEPSTPDSARVASSAPDQTRLSPPVETTVDRSEAVSVQNEPEAVAAEEPVVPDLPAVDDEAVAAIGEPVASEADQAGQQDTPEAMASPDEAAEPDDATPDAASAETEPIATPEANVAAAPAAPDNSVAADQTEAASAAPAPVAEGKANATGNQIGEMLAGLPPRVIASDRSDSATSKVAELLAATPPVPAPTPKDANQEAAVVTPPPPMPRRKPDEEPQVETVAALPAPHEKPGKPAAPVAAPQATVARREAIEPRAKSQWQPMALAPADKPAITPVPTARPTSGAYASKVWSALARHKPRAGQSGSALVMFAIGENGGVRGLRIGRSSGNARIDQLALATVRDAAPFPPPPSGTASYSIRIDFH